RICATMPSGPSGNQTHISSPAFVALARVARPRGAGLAALAALAAERARVDQLERCLAAPATILRERRAFDRHHLRDVEERRLQPDQPARSPQDPAFVAKALHRDIRRQAVAGLGVATMARALAGALLVDVGVVVHHDRPIASDLGIL